MSPRPENVGSTERYEQHQSDNQHEPEYISENTILGGAAELAANGKLHHDHADLEDLGFDHLDDFSFDKVVANSKATQGNFGRVKLNPREPANNLAEQLQTSLPQFTTDIPLEEHSDLADVPLEVKLAVIEARRQKAMAFKRNNASGENGHVNEAADVIEHADGPSSNKAAAGVNQQGVMEYAFKHPFGNVMLGEDHDQVDTFQMSYLLMAMAVLGFIVLVSFAIVILAEIDQLQRAAGGGSSETSGETTTVSSHHA